MAGRAVLYFCSWACFSSAVLLAGKAGKADGLNSGARMAYLSDLDVVDVPFDLADTEERAVAIELTDSFEAFRLNAFSDGFLGGNAGDVADGVRAGNLGAKELCELVVEFLGGKLGREIPSIPFADGLLYVTVGRDSSGSLPIPSFGWSASGGLFVDADRLYAFGLAGTLGLGGGGGGGLALPAAGLGCGGRPPFGSGAPEPTWDNFRAAIRCWIDCGCGSSSAIVLLCWDCYAGRMNRCDINSRLWRSQNSVGLN